MKIGRLILAVLAGAAVWSVLWVGGTMGAQAAFPSILAAGQPVTSPSALAALIAYSVILSVVAGYVTARIASMNPMPAVWALAILQLLIGIGVEASAWDLTPVWYHVAFLALLVPATLAGGRLRARQGPPRRTVVA